MTSIFSFLTDDSGNRDKKNNDLDTTIDLLKTNEVLSEELGLNPNQKYIYKKSNSEYEEKIFTLIEILQKSGTVYRSSGHCLGISSMVMGMLSEFGVKSRLVECSLTAIDRTRNHLQFVGQKTDEETFVDEKTNSVNTHVICITETETPYILDLSIGYINQEIPFICRPIEEHQVKNEKNIATFDFGNSLWIYNIRENSLLPTVYEKSILDRIVTDIKIDKKINLINKFLLCIGIVTSLNFFRGSFDFYQKYINKTNGFGPVPTVVDKNTKN